MKYLEFFKIGFKKSKHIKNEIFGSIINFVLVYFFIFLIWFSIAKKVGNINGYSLNSILVYYFFINFLSELYKIAGENLTWRFFFLIKSGEIKNFLLRPYNIFTYFVLESIGYSFVYLALVFLTFLVVFLFFKSNLLDFLLLLLIIAFSLVFYVSFRILIALFAFWLENLDLLGVFIFNLILIASGRILPLDFYPAWLVKVLNVLPFKYMYYLPSAYFSGKISQVELINGLLIMFSWTFVIFALNLLIFKIGVKKIKAYGG
jgi:ABC-2 type transport system permease protein